MKVCSSYNSSISLYFIEMLYLLRWFFPVGILFLIHKKFLNTKSWWHWYEMLKQELIFIKTYFFLNNVLWKAVDTSDIFIFILLYLYFINVIIVKRSPRAIEKLWMALDYDCHPNWKLWCYSNNFEPVLFSLFFFFILFIVVICNYISTG